MTEANGRRADHPIDELFLERWSPRAFTGETMPHHELLTILEAATWAPSGYNAQPWRFIYAHRDTPHFETLLKPLIPFNQGWAKNASVLLYVVSHTVLTPPGKDQPVPNHSHSFDAGAAWALLALQAHLKGWATHGMTGVDFAAAAEALNVPAEYRIEAAVAIGRRADPSVLDEAARAREVPNSREPVQSKIFEGTFRSA
ncbi:Nitroreductase family protein [Granulibacter bethesdensis]|uniref:Nitroreductase family protein n=1 Tax=Granulibacter bethesdensis TaxID=364410 RepID=A0AAN0RBL6_9PROT|nr:nitroreductase family protein [Granulibacter bethesdensis]AHJ61763.1 Nitroreductase family protein [Granulibacter bethesdensis]